MIDFRNMHLPITLESLSKFAPNAFKELASMDAKERQLLTDWLNQKSSSPVGRFNADVEIDKEDAISSSIKTKYFIPFTSERLKCNYVRHYMSTKQINDFFNNRHEQRLIVKNEVEEQKRQRRDRVYAQDIKDYGKDYILARLKLLAMEKAANDD